MLHMSYASKDSLKLLVRIVSNSAPYKFSFLTEQKGSNTVAGQRSQIFKYILTFHLNHFLQEKVSDVCNSVTQTYQIGVLQI
jgi:hypothetical protein